MGLKEVASDLGIELSSKIKSDQNGIERSIFSMYFSLCRYLIKSDQNGIESRSRFPRAESRKDKIRPKWD